MALSHTSLGPAEKRAVPAGQDQLTATGTLFRCPFGSVLSSRVEAAPLPARLP